MNSDPATTAFVAFCRTGKPELLGEVFDRLAPELMLVAARLLGRGGDAPDVVQQTFLTALQQRRRFDPQRSVAPWLVGILVQHVRRERRRLRRRVDAQRLRHVDADDPLAVAASRDEAEAIRRAMAGMPQPYRQVLQLHLVHGLPPSAVAVSLERPFRTVQSQLRRGLQQLRKTLPRLTLAPLGNRTLELVRADVLHAAASCFGFLLLPWLKLAGLLAMTLPLCVLAVAAMAKGAAANAPVPAEQPLAAVTTPESPLDLPSPDPAATAPLARQLLLAQDPEPVCRVSVQVLRAEDQMPLAGAHVTAKVHDRDAAGRFLPPRELGTSVTDEHGMAIVELPRARQRTADLEISGAARIAIGKTFFPVPDCDTFAFHGLQLWQARPGRIRVRDQDGTPVPFLEVTIGGFAPLHGFMDVQGIRSTTDEQGWTSTMELPVGDKRICLHRVPVEFGQGNDVDLSLSLHGGDHELKLERPDPKRAIRGRVLDLQDQNLPEAWVELLRADDVGSSRVDLQACKLEYSIVSPK